MNANYPQPTVVEAPGGVLDPQDAVNGATVRVTYAMQGTDIIGLAWDNRDDLVPQQNGNSSGTVDFIVPASAVNAAIGRTIPVIYAVARNGAPGLSIILDLTVTADSAEVKPRILKVTGASGDVEDGGVTPDNVLTISGTAGVGLTLDVFDGAYPVETVVVESDGSWKLALSGLTEAEHRITAKNAGGVLVSDPRIFIVSAGAALPNIESVVDSLGAPIAPDGITFDPRITLSGAAEPGAVIEVESEGASWGTAPAISGLWNKTLNLHAGRHVFVAKDLASQAVSYSWTISYVVESLIIDTSPAILNGLLYHAWTAPPFPPAGTYTDRPASGGRPPYRYTSSDTAIATVDESGRVVSAGNGLTTIVVADSVGSTASFTVIVSNVYQFFGSGLRTNHTSASWAVRDLGGYLPSMAEWRLFYAAYGSEAGQLTPLNCWSRDQAPGPNLTNCWAFVPSTGQEQLIPWESPGDAFGIRAIL